jgi:DNA-binding NarL/FixJ family response regulator
VDVFSPCAVGRADLGSTDAGHSREHDDVDVLFDDDSGAWPMKRARVLLADDHADVADELRGILEEQFEVVGVVADGPALLTAVDSLKPDVIVTDISMPGLDGLAATAAIVERAPDARIVLVTVHEETGIQLHGLAAGALGYVVKFRADDDLLPAVQAALRGEYFVGERRSARKE